MNNLNSDTKVISKVFVAPQQPLLQQSPKRLFLTDVLEEFCSTSTKRSLNSHHEGSRFKVYSDSQND